MSGFGETFEQIAQGRQTSALLHTCRMEGLGAEFYGEEAILEAFRARPLDLRNGCLVSGRAHAAMFAGGEALFADVHDERVGRIWRLGGGEPIEAEPRIAVAFDPDLTQARGDILIRAADHPELDPAAVPLVENIGRQLVESLAPALRVRAFLLRAFTAPESSVALFAMYRLGSGPVRSLGFSFAAARFRHDGDRLVSVELIRDTSGEAALQPLRPEVVA